MNNFDPFTDLQPVENNVNIYEDMKSEITPRSNAQGGGSFQAITNKTLTWKSSTKCFNCYDRTTKETTAVVASTEFIPLARTMSVIGSRQVGKRGTPSEHWTRISSNEFTDSTHDLVVVTERDYFEDTKTVIAEGVYQEVKEITKPLPYANFALNVYALVRGTNEIVKFEFSRSSREVGFDIVKNENMVGKCFKLDGAEEKSSGTVQYNVPVISYSNITPEEDQEANRIAQEIRNKIDHNKTLVRLTGNQANN